MPGDVCGLSWRGVGEGGSGLGWAEITGVLFSIMNMFIYSHSLAIIRKIFSQ